jgi:hypothetical protein
MNPAVLTAFALAISADGQGPAYSGVSGHDPDVAAGRRGANRVHRCMNELRAVARNGGSYVSESSYFESGLPALLPGQQLPSPCRDKKKYDPAGLFAVHNGVGSR